MKSQKKYSFSLIEVLLFIVIVGISFAGIVYFFSVNLESLNINSSDNNYTLDITLYYEDGTTKNINKVIEVK